ncbi:uncharacterized protein isoform X2 [Leptinotarsa decemlineata]|uniref:uncharacterized protein isoform X2 n=1 Tax=Leptinotarsa decemlineata TaxID=7539 RepID=UPI003D306485
MRFAYICIVIVISCSVCASGDLEIFPGLKFSFDNEDQISRPRRFDHSNYYSKIVNPFQSLPQQDYDVSVTREFPQYESIPDRTDKIRQYQEVTNWDKYHSRQHIKHRDYHENRPSKFDFSNFDLTIPLINEAWRFSDQKDRYLLKDREDASNGRVIFEQAEPFLYPRMNEKFPYDELPRNVHENFVSHHELHSNDRNWSGYFDSGRFNNVKAVEDPTDFAYAPPDPRFYRRINEPNGTDSPEEENQTDLQMKTSPNNDLKMMQRSELPLENELGNDGKTELKSQQQKHEGVEMIAVQHGVLHRDSAGVYVIAIVAGISAAATVGLIAVGIGWYNLQKHVKNASDVDYPAYGVTGPNKDCSPSGDRRLAQSAQMYHYQHQKQQIIAMERAPPSERNGSVSEAESDEENEEGDYTVYECPGLAPVSESFH